MSRLTPKLPRGVYIALALVAVAAACHRYPPVGLSPESFRAATSGGDWTLTEIAGRPAPMGEEGRAATLRFDPDSARVSGFGGCNRYFGNYTIELTALRFGSLGMTKMACAEGMALEQQLASALDATRSYELSGTKLVLRGDTGTVATFTRPTP